MPFEETPHDADDLVSPVMVREAVQHVGAPEKEHRDYSASLLNTMDSNLRQAASDPCVARALVFALLIDRNDVVAAKQWSSIESLPDKTLFPMTQRLLPHVQCAPEAMRLPLVDMALPSLRRMSQPQYQQFALALQASSKPISSCRSLNGLCLKCSNATYGPSLYRRAKCERGIQTSENYRCLFRSCYRCSRELDSKMRRM